MRVRTFRRALVAYIVLSFVTSTTGYHIVGLPGMSGVAFADVGFDHEGKVTITDAIPSQKEIESGESKYSKDREKPKSCKAAQKEAMAACSDPYSMAGLGPMGQQAMTQAQQQQQQMNNTAGQNPNMGGSAGACEMAAIMNGLQALMAGLKGVGCTAATKDCEEACKDDKDAYCGNGDSAGAAAALGSIFGLLGAMAMANSCKKMMAQATPTPTPGMDCSNPAYAQTNIMCICQADPKNAMCVQREQFPSGLTTTLGDMGPASPTFSDDSFTDDGTGVPKFDGKPSVAKGSQTAEGSGGGGPQGGRGGFYNGAGDRGGPARSTVDKNVIQGLAAGSGGAGGGYGGGAGGGGGGGGKGGGGEGEGERFDLSKFLPKAKTRGLAGMSITSQDGITGPMGPSIWEKVSNQYQLQRQNMIQDR